MFYFFFIFFLLFPPNFLPVHTHVKSADEGFGLKRADAVCVCGTNRETLC